ncbi:hypothetical protein, partial [Collinsella sp.]|uniref:hypothetical protein n=1 Tax=Collinsella sp. TaxID=1965294 RepID=UPI003FF12AF6
RPLSGYDLSRPSFGAQFTGKRGLFFPINSVFVHGEPYPHGAPAKKHLGSRKMANYYRFVSPK